MDTPAGQPDRDAFSSQSSATIARIWLVAFIGYIIALIYFFDKVEELHFKLVRFTGIETLWPTVLLIILPPLTAFFSQNLPVIIERWRRWKMAREGIKGSLVHPAYFRLSPYQNTESDREKYNRPDGAQQRVLEWLEHSTEPLLYLTGRSGSGKSSLLNAYVNPRLREKDHYCIIRIRTSFDPVAALREKLRQPGVIFHESFSELDELDTRQLLERACDHAREHGKDLLLIFDQFEECLIDSNQEEQRKAFASLINGLVKQPNKNVRVLLVVRSDYLGALEALELPPLRQDDNWIEISPFTLAAAYEILNNSGLKIGDKLTKRLLNNATDIEETRGFIRPITLNMLGLILSEVTNPEKSRRLPRAEVSNLLLTYVRDRIGNGEEPRKILRRMITSAGTVHPAQTAEAIGAGIGLDKNAVRGELYRLGNDNLVRRVDDTADAWEVSHDFVARLIDRYLLGWSKPLTHSIYQAVAPILLALWAVVLIGLYILPPDDSPYIKQLSERGFIIYIRNDLYIVSWSQFRYDDAKGEFHLAKEIIEENLRLLDRLNKPVELVISYTTDITDDVLKHLAGLTNLQSLDLRSTAITGEGLKHLAGLINIQTLDLSVTAITGEELKHLVDLTNLLYLDLVHTEITDEGLQHLSGLTHLQRLNLSFTEIRGEGLKHLAGLTNLQTLELSATTITDGGLQNLTALTNLRDLDLSDTTITDEGLKHLAGLTNLQSLDLRSTAITGEGLKHLAGLTNLQTLNLRDTTITDEGLKHLAGLANLQTLYLGVTEITDEGLKHLSGLTNMQTLRITHNFAITDEGLHHLARLTNLQNLDLGVTDITDEGLKHLAGLTNLQRLNLDKTAITDEGLQHLAALKNLVSISFYNTMVTDEGKQQLRAMISRSLLIFSN